MKLSAVQVDAMQELGNIGAAHAATTLSQMLSSTVEMSVPKIKVVDISDLAEHIGEEPAALVVFELQGEIPHGGYIIFYISRKSAVRLTNTMLGLTETDRPLNEMDESALLEVGNIMASAFLDATAELLGFVMYYGYSAKILKIVQPVPEIPGYLSDSCRRYFLRYRG